MVRLSSIVLGVVFAVGLVAVACDEARAENPESTRLSFGLSKRAARKEGRPDRVRIVARHRFSSPIEAGGSCEVTLFSCVQRFVPAKLNPSPDPRDCDPAEIGSVTLTEGNQIVRYISRTLPLRSASRLRQVSLQTSAICTDADELEETLVSNPRARVVSNDGPQGVNEARFTSGLRRRLATSIIGG